MYHRIAEVEVDPWDLAVSPQNFEEQLRILREFNVVPLCNLESVPTKKHFPNNSIAITFDDGYIDNYNHAKPLLETFDMPATFFITTESIERQEEFWWDALERICLQTPTLPDSLMLSRPEPISLKIESHGHIGIDALSRSELYFKLCEIVLKIPSGIRDIFIEDLKAWSSNNTDRASYLTMRRQELLNLDSNPLFNLGAHTVTHPFLANYSYDYQKKEIIESINFLEQLTKNPIKHFAYPHGGHNNSTLEILTQLGLKLAFTTNQGHFDRDSHPFTIPRLHVKNWDGSLFASELRKWMN